MSGRGAMGRRDVSEAVERRDCDARGKKEGDGRCRGAKSGD